MKPSSYFTKARLLRRRKNHPPALVFHFTPRSRAVEILEDGFLRGRPGLSTTENPALISPGPAVFVIDTRCAQAKGLEFWPYIWQQSALQEAEWAVVPVGTEELYDLPHDVELPLECVTYIGLIGRFGVERERILELAAERGIAAGDFDWEEWWHSGKSAKLSGPARRPATEAEARRHWKREQSSLSREARSAFKQGEEWGVTANGYPFVVSADREWALGFGVQGGRVFMFDIFAYHPELPRGKAAYPDWMLNGA